LSKCSALPPLVKVTAGRIGDHKNSSPLLERVLIFPIARARGIEPATTGSTGRWFGGLNCIIHDIELSQGNDAMIATPAHFGYTALDDRRRRLGMSRAIVARRSGVSLPTVTRILTGKEAAPSLPNVQAIAAALGVCLRVGAEVRIAEDLDAEEFRRRQAFAKARRLVRMVQGTMGLESQAVDLRAVDEMTERTVRDLLAGAKRRLWED
jgi:transcriptional regulator with XRE-family HTH domain